MGSPTPPRGTSSPLTLQARWPGGLTPLEAVSLNPAGAVAYIDELRARAERAEAECVRLQLALAARLTVGPCPKCSKPWWTVQVRCGCLLDADAPPPAPDLDAAVRRLREARACEPHVETIGGVGGMAEMETGGLAVDHTAECDACARLAVEAVLVAGGTR